jgi:hypothetical protein
MGHVGYWVNVHCQCDHLLLLTQIVEMTSEDSVGEHRPGVRWILPSCRCSHAKERSCLVGTSEQEEEQPLGYYQELHHDESCGSVSLTSVTGP